MVPELEKARVTELHVRMDCRGCVQKIKKALHSIDGIFSTNIDLASQKLTVVGTAEPEAIVKAIKKARKIATVCSHTEPAGEATGGAAEPAAAPPPPAAEPPANQPPAESETTPPKEEAPPSQGQAAAPEVKEAVPGEPKEVGAIIPVVHHYPYDRIPNYYHYNDHCYYPFPRRYEPPDYAYSGYSHYRTSPYALPQRVRYIQDGVAGDDYSYGGNYRRGGGEVCVFSEENPNACTIV
ncbi:heavy metal-associated isoprenylated plant protein 5-like [Zingiber officinale]|uniref:HMA domain-containing protein n=1 Tax=Zingiber officinale TaxID=94328 RepID=A0A8J5GBH9_ZINOF|nr:heavy metal-associated isoprenylated plant protein 5-like [Zingiber officinale]KAG6504978.1 hypothetical protein ZIOFF_037326 [Zingiber officinale]